MVTRTAAVLVPTLLLAAAAAAPVPPETPTLYYPTRVGVRWVYRAQGEAKKVIEYTRTVTAVDDKDGAKVVSECLVRANGTLGPADVYSVSGRGLFHLGVSGDKFDAPVCLLKLPHKSSARWDWSISGPPPQLPRAGTATAGEAEDVDVPAGSYKAVRVEFAEPLDDGTVRRQTSWYAPNVGRVKARSHDGREIVLKEFVVPKG